MRKLSGNIEQNALQTEWSGWIRDVVHAFGLVDVMRPDTWRVLAPLAESVAAVRWLVGQIRRCRGYYGIKQSRNKSKETHVIALIHRYFIDLISFISLTVKNLFLVHFCCTFVT